MNELRCTVEDLRTGKTWEVALANEEGSWPQYVGRAADAAVVLDDLALAERELRLWPGGLHVQVEPLGAAVTRVRGDAVPIGTRVRVDGPFEVGSYRLEIGFPGEPYED
ncbi:MAG: hypothetical protein R2939_02010 [Kofleriaceae bacterium]